MQSSWDEEGRRVVHASGGHSFVPYLATSGQVARWVAAGFDLGAAATRADAFVEQFKSADAFEEADALLQRHVESEAAIAIDQGVPADDADFHRIASSVRAYVFEPV